MRSHQHLLGPGVGDVAAACTALLAGRTAPPTRAATSSPGARTKTAREQYQAARCNNNQCQSSKLIQSSVSAPAACLSAPPCGRPTHSNPNRNHHHHLEADHHHRHKQPTAGSYGAAAARSRQLHLLTQQTRSRRKCKIESRCRATTSASRVAPSGSLIFLLSILPVLALCLLTLVAISLTGHLDDATFKSPLLFAHSYNLDYQKALLKHGPKGSYFGFSLAQHATYNEQNANSTYRALVIVGAPRADSSRSASLAGVERPGAIYKCDFSLTTGCQQLDIDSLAHPAGSANIYSSLAAEAASLQQAGGDQTTAARPTAFATAASRDPVAQRDNQWLGVSVKSQGPNGFAVVCAHKYVLRGPQFRWPQGICYSLTRNLTLHRTWQPCLNRPVNKAHEEYGSCQAGTASDISDSSDIVLGSPGPYTWRGSVFSNSITFGAKDDRTWYMAPVQDEEAKVYKYSYLGMSIVTGRFFRGQQYFISGAPRSRDAGQVLVMTKQQAGAGRAARGAADSNLRTEQILDGEQMASSFGYTLAKLDFNGDGQLDLAAAAPFYFSKNEGGAVYLYANDGVSRFSPAGRLTGRPESRFGLALANCGDLNHDKYEDLAVGAPYDPAGGSVYIHLGSAQGLRATASQVIRAGQVAAGLQTFGYSLSGGLDMDQNGYPDLAVGSYADDSIFILRARPIVEIHTKIEGNLSRIDPNKTTCDGERNQLPCFKFNTCFELDPAKIGEYSESMKLRYRIEAETFTGQKYSRVKFHESENSESPNVLDKEIIIEDYYRGIKLKRCNTQRVYLKERSDVQTPIQFKLTYSLVPPNESPPGPGPRSSALATRYSSAISYSSSAALSSAGEQQATRPAAAMPPPFPILNQEEAQRIFAAKFLKDCGANDICESHLDVDGALQMPRETLGVNEPGYSTDKQVNVTIRVANSNEPAYESKLFVAHPANLIYSGFRALKQATAVECAPVEKNLVKCELGNPMAKGATKLLMIFNTQNQAGTFDFNLTVNTTSQNAREARTSFDLNGTIRRKLETQLAPKQPPPNILEPPVAEPPAWLLLASTLLGLLLVAALIYCLYVNGFFERPKTRYSAANTEERLD